MNVICEYQRSMVLCTATMGKSNYPFNPVADKLRAYWSPCYSLLSLSFGLQLLCEILVLIGFPQTVELGCS